MICDAKTPYFRDLVTYATKVRRPATVAQREEVVSRRAFLIREYEEIDRTIRYACEVPVQMEAKLGVLAQTLQRGLAD